MAGQVILGQGRKIHRIAAVFQQGGKACRLAAVGQRGFLQHRVYREYAAAACKGGFRRRVCNGLPGGQAAHGGQQPVLSQKIKHREQGRGAQGQNHQLAQHKSQRMALSAAVGRSVGGRPGPAVNGGCGRRRSGV